MTTIHKNIDMAFGNHLDAHIMGVLLVLTLMCDHDR